MIHEFKDIVNQAVRDQELSQKSVLATVVHLIGSSYRKPGVRMLISENMKMTGAVSGGCVEAEVRRRAKWVFENNKPKMMTYDGRYRLGCEGTLYILLEPFTVTEDFLCEFGKALERREEISIHSNYELEDEKSGDFGSVIGFKNKLQFTFNNKLKISDLVKGDVFEQVLKPNLKLLIIGGEHDAVKLCRMASILGWDVDVVTSVKDPKTTDDFPGSNSVQGLSPEMLTIDLDSETVVVLMTHNYALDLKFLVKLTDYELSYLGILGSRKRREQLQNDLLEYKPEIRDEFLECIHSPAGLNIGAITPEEIALSILSEILSIHRNTTPVSLRELSGKIHNS